MGAPAGVCKPKLPKAPTLRADVVEAVRWLARKVRERKAAEEHVKRYQSAEIPVPMHLTKRSCETAAAVIRARHVLDELLLDDSWS